MNIMQWISTNTIVILALGVVWFALLAALYVFRNKMDISETFFTALAALALFGAIVTWGTGVIGWGYMKAKTGVSNNPIVTDVSAAIPGLSLPVYQPQQAVAPASQAQAQPAAQNAVQPASAAGAVSQSVPLAPAPAPVQIMRQDAFTRWFSAWPSGSPPGLDLVTTNGGVTARSVPQGVYCIMLWGGDFWTGAGNEQWPAECHYNGQKASKNIGGTWGRHYFEEKADSLTVTGTGEWPTIAYDWVTPAEPQVSFTAPAAVPAAAPAAVPAPAAQIPAPAPTQAPAPAQSGFPLVPVTPTPAPVTITVDPGPQPTPKPMTATVGPGESLAVLALRYFNDREKWKYLCDLNQLPNCNIVHVGQVIRIQ